MNPPTLSFKAFIFFLKFLNSFLARDKGIGRLEKHFSS